jgi:hypothetical protein
MGENDHCPLTGRSVLDLREWTEEPGDKRAL